MNELKLLENGIIPVYQSDKGAKLVNVRELHTFLEVNSKFADWIKNRIEKYGFIENHDFITLSKNLENGGRSIDYVFKLEPAKEIAMIENNEKGKQVRRYFIYVEEKYKEKIIDTSKLSPELQLFNQMFQTIASNELRMKQMEQIAIEAKTEVAEVKGFVNEVKETMAELPKDQWRKWVNSSLNAIAFKRGGGKEYEKVKTDSYTLLDNQGFDVQQRVKNLQARLALDGATKTKINSVNPLDVIEADSKMRKIYDGIIKEMRIKNLG